MLTKNFQQGGFLRWDPFQDEELLNMAVQQQCSTDVWLKQPLLSFTGMKFWFTAILESDTLTINVRAIEIIKSKMSFVL